jgi:hypothetical protein
MQGDSQRRFHRQDSGKPDHQPTSTDVRRASFQEAAGVAPQELACDGQVEGYADTGMPRPLPGVQEFPKGLELIGSNLGKDHAVRTDPRGTIGHTGPYHLRIRLDCTSLSLQAKTEGRLGPESPGHLQTRPPSLRLRVQPIPAPVGEGPMTL